MACRCDRHGRMTAVGEGVKEGVGYMEYLASKKNIIYVIQCMKIIRKYLKRETMHELSLLKKSFT